MHRSISFDIQTVLLFLIFTAATDPLLRYLAAAEGVYRVPKTSGQGELVAKGTDMVDGHLIMGPAYDVAVDGSCVYWSAPTGVYVEKK